MVDISLAELHTKRKIVVHHTHILKDKIIQCLKPKDLVFFDDCLFSQWVFIKDHITFFEEKQIKCILGFSSGLYAPENASSQIYEVESYVLHDACNKRIQTLVDANNSRDDLNEMNGFMKVSQLKELLEFPFINLALHGCCHLELKNEKKLLKKIQLFENDLKNGIENIKVFGLQMPTIFVYPYVYSFSTSDMILKKAGFNKIVGSKIFRIQVETLFSSEINTKA